MSKIKLAVSASVKFALGVALVGCLLFLPAGGFGYPNAWLFMGLLFVPMILLGIALLIFSPALLEKRLSAKESERDQKGVVAASALIFIGGFIVAGLDFRFGWSSVPAWTVIAASAILLASYALYAEVMRENAYLSRTVKVTEGQRVVDRGLYSIVRHPMYAVTLWLFFSIPVVLGSWWALACFAPYALLIAARIVGEERLLEESLEGYSEYKKRVRYRLIPFVW